MAGLRDALAVELLKARRSRVPWLVAAGLTMVPLVSGLFMFILKDPERARQLGLLGLKAQLTGGTADWVTYMGFIGQAVAVGGGIVFALLTAWVFGREFADRTVRGLLAIPTARATTVTAKLLTVTLWALAMTAWVLALGYLVGLVVDMPGLSTRVVLEGTFTAGLAAVLSIGLQAGAAYFAGVGHGYLGAMAWTLLTVFAAQVLAVLGFGSWFPWSVPALLTGAAGPGGETVTAASYVIVAVTVMGLSVATFRWWERTDHTG